MGRLLDRLSRGVRIFRINAPMDGVEHELREIRLALQAICREAFGVELAPATTAKPPRGAEKPYFEDGGADDHTLVRALMADSGLRFDEPGEEPEFEGVSLADAPPAPRPFASFLRPEPERDEEPDDDESGNRIPTARRATADAGPATLQPADGDETQDS